MEFKGFSPLLTFGLQEGEACSFLQTKGVETHSSCFCARIKKVEGESKTRPPYRKEPCVEPVLTALDHTTKNIEEGTPKVQGLPPVDLSRIPA